MLIVFFCSRTQVAYGLHLLRPTHAVCSLQPYSWRQVLVKCYHILSSMTSKLEYFEVTCAVCEFHIISLLLYRVD